MTFEIGDVVIMKSGGPAMTVVNLYNDEHSGRPQVRCSWFNSAEALQYQSFIPEALRKIEE
ncbi:YodC family protein [Pseudomonas sp. 2(2015)]|uniref:YodC family protein n=1 Tax=Pseudomonas TaxID=286 RepID=UPI0005EB85E3|nr:DUF2158 domain-containing protein [Pseudomonas sp. 2(2015)]KJK14710.1 hypothetical protein UB48_24755 [Pseudomonas sp. 2(2015)]